MHSSHSFGQLRCMIGEATGALICDLKRARFSGVPFVDLNEELDMLNNLVKRCRGALSTVPESLVSELFSNLLVFLQKLTTKQTRLFKVTVGSASTLLKACVKVLSQGDSSSLFSPGLLWVPSTQSTSGRASYFFDPDVNRLANSWRTSNISWISKRKVIALPTIDGMRNFYEVVIRFSSSFNAALFGRNEHLSSLVGMLTLTTLCCQKFAAEANVADRQLTVIGKTMNRILAAKKLMTCVVKHSMDESCLISILNQLNRKCKDCQGVSKVPSSALFLPTSFLESRSSRELTLILQMIINLYILRENCVCDKEIDEVSDRKVSSRTGSASISTGRSSFHDEPFTARKAIRTSSLEQLAKNGGRIIRMLEAVTNSKVCILSTSRSNFSDLCITGPTAKEGMAACAMAQLALADEKAFYFLCNAYATRVPKQASQCLASTDSNGATRLSDDATAVCAETVDTNSKKDSKEPNAEKAPPKESRKREVHFDGDNHGDRYTHSVGSSTPRGISTIRSNSL